jgi:hypothetical protein
MTPDLPASSGFFRGIAPALLACVCVLASGTARADGVLLFAGGEPRDAATWRARVAPHAGARLVPDLDAWAVAQVRGVARARLLPLARIEALLARARGEAAALDENGALATLAEAEREAGQLGDLPGAAHWNAEIQLGIGVTAVQAGITALAEDAFRRAATLDPERALLSAEAAPAAVALYERVARQVAASAFGEFEVLANAPAADVYLNDVPQGPAPARVRAPVGRHLLRVEARGHSAYGAFVDVLAGERAPLRVELAREPALDAARQLERAARTGDYTALVAAARALAEADAELSPVLVLERARHGDRALLVRCAASGCRAPLHLPFGELPGSRATAEALDDARLASARRWLAHAPERQAPEDATPLWQRWYVWGGVAAAGIAAAALAWSAGQPAERRLEVVVEPQELRR